MNLMIAQIVAPLGVIIIVLFIMWAFTSMFFWLADVVWNAVDFDAGNFQMIKYEPVNYG